MQTPGPGAAPLPEWLVLFDGMCAVCDASVQWLLDHDRDRRLCFAPLQGVTASTILARHPELPERLDSLVLVERVDGEERLSWHSTGVLRMARLLPAPWCWLAGFTLMPRLLRDPAYRAFARVRYRIFGRLEQCRIPDPDDAHRFLP